MKKVIDGIEQARVLSLGLIYKDAHDILVRAKLDAEELNERLVRNLDWMVETMKFKHDSTGISVGAYSPELLEAIKLLEELKSVR